MNPLKTWTAHNLIAHPVSEIVFWLVRPFSRESAQSWSGWIHDRIRPDQEDRDHAMDRG